MEIDMLRLSMSAVLRVLRAPVRLPASSPALLASRLLATSLLAAAPAAFAGERIIEIWNPPEARLPAGHTPEARRGAHLIGKSATTPHRRKVLAHRSASAPHQHQTAQRSLQQGSPQGSHEAASQPRNPAANEGTRHATTPAIDASRLKHNEVPAPKHDLSHFEDIPRIVTPEGNVLRVGTGGATAQVTR
ncbi:hypothetical protein QYH69_01710 [Paraburkholderia sp. SARCC-3016]|uniref:hypothetical protein n=1 Tax=Paraburkholderia sp. SARCC-3016 TaxID=3058611 RepID=UPI002807018F|nr:hypothetical protein [Paraburkholderia sp. SARCC-3016]MDQ7975961.1 hypothetical protein [Paraburkholderia sp. SARCC-3016]